MTEGDLIERYCQLAERRGTARSVRAANAAHDKLLDVVRALRDSGQGRRILDLLASSSPHVRLRAAFDALYLSPDDGLPVLRALASEVPGEVGADARIIIEMWERNKVTLYPWEDDDAAIPVQCSSHAEPDDAGHSSSSGAPADTHTPASERTNGERER